MQVSRAPTAQKQGYCVNCLLIGKVCVSTQHLESHQYIQLLLLRQEYGLLSVPGVCYNSSMTTNL